MKNRGATKKSGAFRFTIKADCVIIGYEYTEKAAERYAAWWSHGLANQDEPQFPKMTIEREEAE